LWCLRQDAELIVPVLAEILGRKERRWQAAYALGEIGPEAAAAVPALARALEDEHVPRPFRTPPSAAFALGKIGKAAIPELSALLSHPEARMRMGSLLAFGIMGTDGKDAVPALLKLLKDQDSEVRHTAALTLAAVGAAPEQIVGGLTDCLSAEDIYMRSAAAAALREIAPDGNWVVSPE
jgi:HEAT repeat protein